MVRDWMMFRVVIALVETARFPIYIVLFLFLAVANPKESHVECLGTLLLESIMRESDRCSIVSLDWSPFSRLWVAEVLQTIANRNTFLTIKVQSTRFGFGRTANNNFDDGTKNVDGAVVVTGRRILGGRRFSI